MDLGLIRKLVRLMQSAELTELEIDDTKAGMRVHLRRGNGLPEGMAPPASVVQVLPGGSTVGPILPEDAPARRATGPAEGGEPSSGGTVAFESPLVGTFYRAASPETDPFVEVGAKVTEDTVLCIIEAMKVMNEIKAEARGEIVEILVENGEPVEFGQPLFLLKPV